MRKTYIRRRKQKKPILLIVLLTILLLIIIAILVVTFMNRTPHTQEPATNVSLFFYDTQTLSLKPEIRAGTATEKVDIIKFILQELVVGPRSVALKSNVPDDVITFATLSGTNVNVDMSSTYHSLPPDQKILCRTSIVCSLTELDFVDTVSFTVEESELLGSNGQPFGKIKPSDIVMVPDIAPQGEIVKTLTLYFADEAKTGLVAENRTISINPNEPIAQYIVSELIEGPRTQGLSATVPPETKINAVSTSDGICSLDLSKEFITKYSGDKNDELLTIYSIVNSLCEESDIKNVQFMIEGERQESFREVQEFKNLFEAKEMLAGD